MNEIPCNRCGGNVIEFSVPNDIWNTVIRQDGHERDDEYICHACWYKSIRQHLSELKRQNELLRTVAGKSQDAKQAYDKSGKLYGKHYIPLEMGLLRQALQAAIDGGALDADDE